MSSHRPVEPEPDQGWTRRAFLAAGAASFAAGLPSVARCASPPNQVHWAPYHGLELTTQDLLSDEGIRRTVWWANEFEPQTNIEGLAPWDPRRPGAPGTARRLDGRGKRIQASTLSLCRPDDYPKALQVKKGVARLLATGDAAVRDQLSVDIQLHTVRFDHPTRGTTIPPGFEWDWVMTVPHEQAERHRRAFEQAGIRWQAVPAVEFVAERVAGRGWPTGWLGRSGPDVVQQYTIMPDLRIPECRALLLGRLATIIDGLGLENVWLSGKSAWLHGASAPWMRPGDEHPGHPGPWLPSPYPGDSYRDANVALVREAVDRFGARHVTWTNTGKLTRAERAAQGLPDYVGESDGGIRAQFDRFYGSRETNWRLPMLERRGFFRGSAARAPGAS